MSAIQRQLETIHSPQQRERLKAQLRSIEARLQGKFDMPKNKSMKEKGLSTRRQGYYEQFQWKEVQENRENLERQAARIRQTIEKGTGQPLSKAERAVAEKRRAENEAFLRKNLTPNNLYYAKPGTPEFEHGKKVCKRETSPEIQRVKDQYVRDTRALDPDNDARNLVERLRPSS
jgi:hypothetical protein